MEFVGACSPCDPPGQEETHADATDVQFDPLFEALKRIVGGRDAISFYEAGMDQKLSADIEEGFRIFQGSIIEEYEKMVEEFGLVVIDSSGSIEEQQDQMRTIVKKALNGARKTRIRTWVDLNVMVKASRQQKPAS